MIQFLTCVQASHSCLLDKMIAAHGNHVEVLYPQEKDFHSQILPYRRMTNH